MFDLYHIKYEISQIFENCTSNIGKGNVWWRQEKKGIAHVKRRWDNIQLNLIKSFFLKAQRFRDKEKENWKELYVERSEKAQEKKEGNIECG